MTVMLLEWVCTSAFLILVTLVLRAALGKRIGGAMRYALWAAVLLRLLVPVQLFTSPLAGTWVAAGQRVERDVVEWSAAPTAPAGEALGLPVVDKTPGTVPSAPKAPALPHPPEPPAAPDLSKLAPWLGWAWLAGAGLAALVLLLSNLRFYGQLRRVRTRLEGADCPLAVYAAPGLPSPCLFGLLRPAVYVTPEAAADPAMLRHVLAHEYTHYRHGDHIWSLLRCAALAIHWWDPLVWLAAALSRRDGELACDEGALKRLGEGERAAYGATLLALVTAKPAPGDLFRCATTMAGDKKSLKERITRIAAAPKRVLWAVAAAVLVTALACVCAFGQAEPEAHTLEPSDDVPDGSHAMDGSGVVQPSPGPLASSPPAPSAGELDFQFYAAHSDMTLRFSQLTRAVTPSIEVQFEPEEYTILDLDRDGADELIVKLMGQGGYLILHPTEDGLWGYTKVVRGLMDLKADGTFTGSSGAGDWGFSTVSAFGPDRMEEVCFTWCESTGDGGQRCFVNGSPAVLREFEAAVDLQDRKESAPWRPWTGGDQEVIRWLEEAGVDYDLSGPGGEAGLTADLDRNGIPETIQVTEIDGGTGKRLEVWENGKLLFAEEGFSAHAGYNALFLCNDGEGEYLLRYHPTMYQGYGTYNYQLFTLENGVETVAMEDEVEFDVNFHPMMHQSFDPEAIAAFMDDVNGLLSHSVQLLNTDQDLLDTFQWNGLLYDDLWWLDTWEPVFVRDESKTLRENLRDFQAAMEGEWSAEAPKVSPMDELGKNVRLSYGDKQTRFSCPGWDCRFQIQVGEGSMDAQVLDLNGDGRDEIVFSLVEGHGTGCLVENLFAFDADTLEQYDTHRLNETILNSIRSTGDKDNFYLSAPGMDRVTISKSEAAEALGFDLQSDTMGIGDIIFYQVGADGAVRCRVACDASGKTIGYIGYIEAELEFTGSGFRIARAEYREGDAYSN